SLVCRTGRFYVPFRSSDGAVLRYAPFVQRGVSFARLFSPVFFRPVFSSAGRFFRPAFLSKPAQSLRIVAHFSENEGLFAYFFAVACIFFSS
ncbi:MAG: hypothetical protein IKX66_03040, partial [Clostridia bacterium]|nr:hypothetical protein [Clostridia bacterium]